MPLAVLLPEEVMFLTRLRAGTRYSSRPVVSHDSLNAATSSHAYFLDPNNGRTASRYSHLGRSLSAHLEYSLLCDHGMYSSIATVLFPANAAPIAASTKSISIMPTRAYHTTTAAFVYGAKGDLSGPGSYL